MSNELSFFDQSCFCTARLECKLTDGQTSIGTSFFFAFPAEGGKSIPLLVTNRHVVKNASTGLFRLTAASPTGGPSVGQTVPVILDDFEKRWIGHPDDDVDLCVMAVAPLFEEARQKDLSIFHRQFVPDYLANHAFLAELPVLQEVFMVGYPAGVWDDVNNMPILRRGVLATSPSLDYQGRKEFMVDLACFPGSSGSPIVLHDIWGSTDRKGNTVLGQRRAKLLGILYAGPQLTIGGEVQMRPVPTRMEPIALSRIPINLGLVIKAAMLLDFGPLLKEL